MDQARLDALGKRKRSFIADLLAKLSGLLDKQALDALGWLEIPEMGGLACDEVVDKCWARCIFPWRQPREIDEHVKSEVQLYLAYLRSGADVSLRSIQVACDMPRCSAHAHVRRLMPR